MLTITASLGDLKQAKVSNDRLEELHTCLPGEPEPNGGSSIVSAKLLSIQTQGAVCRYPGGDPFPLMDLNLRGPGLHLLRGANGVGKSSLFVILAGLRRAEARSILVNGEDVAQMAPGDLRRVVCHVPQTRQLFSATVRENITMGRDWSDNQITEAFTRLAADEVLASLPRGLDTHIGHEGHELSGGQEQLVYLIQMLLDDRPIVLLDEPFNSLDLKRQVRVREIINDLSKTRLVVMIIHDSDSEPLLQQYSGARDPER